MANPLTEILEKGKELLKSSGGGGSALGVDIGTSSIKVVQLKEKSGKVVLETYGEISLGPYAKKEAGAVTSLPPEDIVAALGDVMKDANVTTKQAAFAIQASASLVVVLEVPKAAEKQLASLILNEARKYIPAPINEVTLDWWAIPEKGGIEDTTETVTKEGSTGIPPSRDTMEVLVAAIHKDMLAKYQEIASSAGLSGGNFEIEIFSTIRSSFGQEMSPVMVIDFGASGTRVAIIEYGVVKTFRTINRGSHHISDAIQKSLNVPFTKAEELKKEIGLKTNTDNPQVSEIATLTLNYIFGEAQNILLGYEKKYNKVVAKIILAGGGSLMPGLLERAGEEFKAEVSFAHPFEKAESPEFIESLLRTVGPGFSVAMGLALKQLQ